MSHNFPLTPVVGRTLPAGCLARIKKDMVSIHTEPPPGIYVVHDEEDISLIYALITGPRGTPYEGEFFYFLMRCPNNYPISPPAVRFMTTGGGTVRFNPNLYKDGKVCLSILGTFYGPSWSPAQTSISVLLSIQSLLSEEPYYNEPGYEISKSFTGQSSKKYNEVVQHETIRVAVCGMLENETHLTIPEYLKKLMRKIFLEFYDEYESIVEKNTHLDGQELRLGAHQCSSGKFRYAELLQRLQALRKKCKAETVDVEDKPPEAKVPKQQTSTESEDNTLYDLDYSSDDESD